MENGELCSSDALGVNRLAPLIRFAVLFTSAHRRRVALLNDSERFLPVVRSGAAVAIGNLLQPRMCINELPHALTQMVGFIRAAVPPQGRTRLVTEKTDQEMVHQFLVLLPLRLVLSPALLLFPLRLTPRLSSSARLVRCCKTRKW